MPECTYDIVPYPKNSHRHTHPRKLEAIATLLGMEPPPVTDCRVLELGCAAGSNLIPQAEDFPGSRFLGIDLSARQIDDGRAVIESLGLENIELRQADIMDVILDGGLGGDDSSGRFDYILCHGVFSWVPRPVQEKIFAICKEHLSPQGVAMISYNVYPGWHFRGMIREMMCYHVDQFEDPAEQIPQARAMLDFMVDVCSDKTPFGKMLQASVETIHKVDDAYLYHEYLETNNRPIYFHRFVEWAQECGLQYLCDTDYAKMLTKHLPPKVQAALKNASLVRREQYIDFMRNNTFRRTLLCHENVALTRDVRPDVLKKFHVMLSQCPGPVSFDVNSKQGIKITIGESAINTDSPLVKASLKHLIEIWPAAIGLDRLRALGIDSLSAEMRSNLTEQQLGIEMLAGAMMEAFGAGMLELFVHPPQVAGALSDRPKVSPRVRLQATQGSLVTNQLHDDVKLDVFPRRVIERLDGRHDRKSLVDRIEQDVARGTLTLLKDGQAATRVQRDTLAEMVDQVLADLRRLALLSA